MTRFIAYPSMREGTRYEIPEGITIIDELSFSRAGYNGAANTLKTIVLPNIYVLSTTLPSNYLNKGTNLSVGIYNKTGVEAIEVKADNPNYKTTDGILYSKDGTILWYVPMNKTGSIVVASGVTTIKGGAFTSDNGSGLKYTSITIPASVTEIDTQAKADLKLIKTKNSSVTITFAEGSIFSFDASGNVVTS